MSYKVKPGDTLGKIANHFNLSIADILTANPTITDPNNIHVGQLIIIPQPVHNRQLSSLNNGSGQSARFPGISGLFSFTSNIFSSYQTPIKSFANHYFKCCFFDRKVFFDNYRKQFGKLSQGQVEGVEALLTSFETDDKITEIKKMAYMFATIKHETAETYKPIAEYGNKAYFNRYDPELADTKIRQETAKKNGNTEKGDGYKYRGRGYVQITWKNNYKRLGDAIGYNLVAKPDDALAPEIAYKIMSYGMRKGAFTGKKLSDYIMGSQADYKNARKIINGLDKAEVIKGYAEKFEKILNESIVR